MGGKGPSTGGFKNMMADRSAPQPFSLRKHHANREAVPIVSTAQAACQSSSGVMTAVSSCFERERLGAGGPFHFVRGDSLNRSGS